jgi:ABC-type lipoprotein release transport system permease subunit
MIFLFAWRNLWRNRRRSMITMASIMFAVFFAVITRSMQVGVYDFMIDSVVGKFSGYIQVHRNGYWDEQIIDNAIEYDEALIRSILEIEEVEEVYPRVEGFALGANNELTKGTMVIGMDLSKERMYMELDSHLLSGSIPEPGSDGVLIGSRYAEFFSFGVGDSLILIGQGYHGISATGLFPIAGIVQMPNPILDNSLVLIDLPMGQWFYGTDNMVTSYVVGLENSYVQEKVLKRIAKDLDPEYEVLGWREMLPDLVQMIEADEGGGIIMILILYLIISFGMFGTVLMMTQERRHEFGILIAVGMKRLRLMGVVLAESVLMSLLGVLMGLVVAFPLVYYFYENPIDLSGGEMGDAYEKYGFEPLMPASLDPSIPVNNGLLVLIIAILISLYPVLKIRAMKVVDAMKS